MHAFRERTRSHNPTLWVVTTTGDQHCRALHGMSKRERNSGLRALPAHAPALKPPRKARFLFSKSSISLLDCWFVSAFSPKSHWKTGLLVRFPGPKSPLFTAETGLLVRFPGPKSPVFIAETGPKPDQKSTPKTTVTHLKYSTTQNCFFPIGFSVHHGTAFFSTAQF